MNNLFKTAIVTCLSLIIVTSVFAQQRVTMDVKGESFEKIVRELKRITGYEFIFSDSYVDVSRKVSLSANNSSLVEVLDMMVLGTNIKYSIVDNKVVFSQKKSTNLPETSKEKTINEITVSG